MSHEVEVCNITVTAENGDTAEYRLIIGVGTEIEEGFFDNFDVASYRKRYPQLSQEYGNDLDAYYEHYFLIGKVEDGMDRIVTHLIAVLFITMLIIQLFFMRNIT